MSKFLTISLMSFGLFGGLCGSLIGLTACTKKAESTANTNTTSPNSVTQKENSALNTLSQIKELNVSIWANYISPEVQQKFTEATGIKLNITNYSSNEELLTKLQLGGSNIDLAIPSDYMVDIMIKLNLLEPLDKEKIPNLKNIDPKLVGLSYDKENKYSLPYAWTTTGLTINKDLVKSSIKSWKDMFNDKNLSGKVSLLDDVREALAPALKLHNHSVNTINPDELKKAKETLINFKKSVKLFSSDPIDLIVNKEVAIAEMYSSDALQAIKKSKNKLTFIYPSEGSIRSIDNMILVKSSNNKENAMKLMNFLLQPEINALFVKTIMAGPVLTQTKNLLPEDLKSNEALFPSKDVLSKLESVTDLGENTKLYEDIWTEIKTK